MSFVINLCVIMKVYDNSCVNAEIVADWFLVYLHLN